MAVNKVVFGAVAIMDISDSTVTPETLAKDAVAYAADGERIVGTLEAQEPALQSKTVSPSTSSQTVKPDSGYDGLSQVTVNAMPTATQATPSVSVDANGKITATATQSAGYVAAGTKTGTKQMTTQAAKTITPSTSSQTAVAKNVYTTGAVTVAAIPSKYQDVTTPLAELNTANGGTAASTMAAAVNNTEALTGTQTDLIAQIATALEGKAAGGGSGSGVETCSVTVTNSTEKVMNIDYLTVENGAIARKEMMYFVGSATIDIVRNSFVSISNDGADGFDGHSFSCGNCSVVRSVEDSYDGYLWSVNIVMDTDATTATITLA